MLLVKEIKYQEAINFIMPRHYSGRKPQITKAFGLYQDNVLVSVCTFGKPASPSLCKGILGGKYSDKVYELNRLCRLEEYRGQLSYFVSKCLKKLKPLNWIVVSYSDMAMNHHGYIYQACNFIYTGCTKQRTDKYTPGGKHSRHYKNEDQGKYRIVRSPKHRYVYFCCDKKTQKEYKALLKYPILPYPKGNNKNYVLGEFLKPEIISINGGINGRSKSV